MAETEQAIKHQRLYDASWLRQRYEIDLRTEQEIAEELGCHRFSVIKALKRHAIPTRTSAETRHLRGINHCHARFPMLYDTGWLRLQYVEQGKSIAAIATTIECSPSTVLNALVRAGIPRRPSGRRSPARTRVAQAGAVARW